MALRLNTSEKSEISDIRRFCVAFWELPSTGRLGKKKKKEKRREGGKEGKGEKEGKREKGGGGEKRGKGKKKEERGGWRKRKKGEGGGGGKGGKFGGKGRRRRGDVASRHHFARLRRRPVFLAAEGEMGAPDWSRRRSTPGGIDLRKRKFAFASQKFRLRRRCRSYFLVHFSFPISKFPRRRRPFLNFHLPPCWWSQQARTHSRKRPPEKSLLSLRENIRLRRRCIPRSYFLVHCSFPISKKRSYFLVHCSFPISKVPRPRVQ